MVQYCLMNIINRVRSFPVGFWILLIIGIYSASVSHVEDSPVYASYAHLALAGHGGIPKEYPITALGLFILPALFPIKYEIAFGLFASLAFGFLCYKIHSRRWLVRFLLYSGLSMFMIIFGRYDIFPVICLYFSIENARKEQWGKAWVYATIGGMLKIFPFLLLPGYLLYEYSKTKKINWKRPFLVIVSFCTILGIQALLAPGTEFNFLHSQLNRGFELSSLGGSITFLTGYTKWIYGFKTWEIVGPHFSLIKICIELIGGIVLIGLFLQYKKLNVTSFSLSILTIFILMNHSFAPQYLLWIIPLWSYYAINYFWIASAVLSCLIFPFSYSILANTTSISLFHTWLFPTFIALIRNIVFIAGSLLWFRKVLDIQNKNYSYEESYEILSPI